MNVDANQADMSEDQVFTSRQAARHVCVAFRRYFEAHLAMHSDQIRRSHMHSQAGSPLVETPAYKVCLYIYSLLAFIIVNPHNFKHAHYLCNILLHYIALFTVAEVQDC